jgi:hypothetical protein
MSLLVGIGYKNMNKSYNCMNLDIQYDFRNIKKNKHVMNEWCIAVL